MSLCHIPNSPDPVIAIFQPSTRCPRTFPPFPVTWLPHPSSYLFPIPCCLFPSPHPPPHLHLIPSSVTHYIYQPTSIVPLLHCQSCLVALSLCFLNPVFCILLSETWDCLFWTSAWSLDFLPATLDLFACLDCLPGFDPCLPHYSVSLYTSSVCNKSLNFILSASTVCTWVLPLHKTTIWHITKIVRCRHLNFAIKKV